MGAAVPIVSAGVSVLGGLSQASQAKQQAKAQSKAIANQNEIEQLNARLQLVGLKQQQALASVQDELQTAAEKQAYLARLAAIDQQELINQGALAEATLQNTTDSALAAAKQMDTETQALVQATDATSSIGRELTAALRESGGELSGLFEALSKQPEAKRSEFYSSLLDLAASAGGTNEALALLNESTDTREVGRVARATESASTQQATAKASAAALRGSVEANRSALEAQAAVGGQDARYQSSLQALDIQASRKVADAAFASERLSTEGAYKAGTLARGVEQRARTTTAAASEEVLTRGAALSQATAQAQASSIRSPGFFDYLGILGGGAVQYVNSGGSLGFLQRRQPTPIQRGVDVLGDKSNLRNIG